MTGPKVGNLKLARGPEALTGPHKGIIDRLVMDKKFGFIHADNGKDYFFHKESLVDPDQFQSLDLGDVVRFEGAVTIKGCRALTVQLVEGP